MATKRLTQQPAPLAPGATRAPLATTQAPQLATAVETPPTGGEWLSELKWDGYRLLVWIERGSVRLVTRNGHDWTDRMPRLAARFLDLKVDRALIDGELVALRPDGTDSFHDLQSALSEGRDGDLHFYAFDLLHLNGWDIRPCALADRKRLLKGIKGWSAHLRYSDHLDCDPAVLLAEARRLNLEGIICKRADSPYKAGRHPSWLKIKCLQREEFVALGWLPPGGSRKGIGSLALGFYDLQGRMHYAGSVGTGFTDRELVDLRDTFGDMAAKPPASLLYGGEKPDRHIQWVEQKLVVEVSFTAWSGEGRVRHPVYLGMNEDKTPSQVVKVVPDPEKARLEYRPVLTVAVPAKASASRWKGAVPPRKAVTPL